MELYQRRIVFDLYTFYRLHNTMTVAKLYFLVFVTYRQLQCCVFEAVLISNTARSAARTLDPTSTYLMYYLVAVFYCLHLHILFVMVTQTAHICTQTGLEHNQTKPIHIEWVREFVWRCVSVSICFCVFVCRWEREGVRALRHMLPVQSSGIVFTTINYREYLTKMYCQIQTISNLKSMRLSLSLFFTGWCKSRYLTRSTHFADCQLFSLLLHLCSIHFDTQLPVLIACSLMIQYSVYCKEREGERKKRMR